MREFKRMRHYLAENKILFSSPDVFKLSNIVMQNKEDIQEIKSVMATKSDFDSIMDNFIKEDNIKEKLFLDGQIFDAADAYISIYKQAKRSIYIIDDYISIDTLHLLTYKQTNTEVIIFSANKGKQKLTSFEITKFNEQYPTLTVKYTTNVHDRFIIIDYDQDDEKFYVCGASSKDAGKRICTITQLYDKTALHHMIDTLLTKTTNTY